MSGDKAAEDLALSRGETTDEAELEAGVGFAFFLEVGLGALVTGLGEVFVEGGGGPLEEVLVVRTVVGGVNFIEEGAPFVRGKGVALLGVRFFPDGCGVA